MPNDTQVIEVRPTTLHIVGLLLEMEQKEKTTYAGYTLEAYIDHLLMAGHDARKRGVEAGIERRKDDEAKRAVAAGLERFAQTMLKEPQKYETLESLIQLGSDCKVPAGVVLEYYQRRNEARKAAAVEAAAKKHVA